ncbi:hypothetical protein [Flavisphingomonas formosensis]|uniref:hypothetical protein n=1 Tax=Flavisphingomonas formosensis TaxID=861534 RepID=UPI0012F75C92|nr:hypothetical protein [Sphingomonas formosensis]
MTQIETSQQRAGGPERERRQDGGGSRTPPPGSETERGNVEPRVDAPHAAEEIWSPEKGTRKISGADAAENGDENAGPDR